MYDSLGLAYIWHVNLFQHDVQLQKHQALLYTPPSSSSSSSDPAPSFSSNLSLLHSFLFSLLFCCLGHFMKATLIWRNQYLHNVGCGGAGQRLGGGDRGWWRGGGVCLCVGGKGGMLLNKHKPIDLFCTSLCVRGSTETPQGLTDRRGAGSGPQRQTESVCVHVCVCVTVVMWVLYRNYMRACFIY